MGVRRAFIDWQKFDKDTKLENGKEYLLAVPVSGKEAALDKATYYDKGAVIDIPLADEALPSGKGLSPEEKLIVSIFGAGKSFIVPEDGFWKVTGEYGVDDTEYNGAFEGCKEQAVCLGNRYGWDSDEGAIPVLWAEMPIMPKGTMPKAKKPEPVKKGKDGISGLQKDFADNLERIQSDTTMANVYKYFCKGSSNPEEPVECMIGQAVYSLTPFTVAWALNSAWAMCKALSKVPEQEVASLPGKMTGMDKDKAVDMVKAFCEKYAIPVFVRRFLFYYADYLNDDCDDFYYHRDKLMAEGGLTSFNMPAVFQVAWAKSSLPYRIGRLVKLIAMEAPEIILANELRILVERLLAAGKGRTIICVGPNFDAAYGVMPDGSRGIRHCTYGDKELQLLSEEDPEVDESENAEAAEEMELPEGLQEPEEEEKPEPKAGVDYPYFAVMPAPNFLMRKCRWVLWDNMEIKYLRDDDGNIEQFQDWGPAKARADELAKAKA